MHKRIIWALFFAAFILDFYRSRSTTSQSDHIHQNTKEQVQQKEIDLNDISNKPKEGMKAKMGDEELEITYEDDNINNHKRKNKNIDLRIEFCQS